MENVKFNGFDSQERYDNVRTAVYNAFVGFGYSNVEMIPATQIMVISVEYEDHFIELHMNLFDGLFSVDKYDSEGEEDNHFDRIDLDIIRRADLIADEVIGIAYLDNFETSEEE